MEKKELLNYEAPQVEVVEVEVERGFEGSGEGGLNNFNPGGPA